MSTYQRILNSFIAIVSLFTATGVFMHDSRVDKAAMTALDAGKQANYKFVATSTKFKDFVATDAHTHPDHNAAKSLLNSFARQSPSTPPRDQEQKKHMMQRVEPRGRHAFDNYNLPVID